MSDPQPSSTFDDNVDNLADELDFDPVLKFFVAFLPQRLGMIMTAAAPLKTSSRAFSRPRTKATLNI
jgi:hypothetical protein